MQVLAIDSFTTCLLILPEYDDWPYYYVAEIIILKKVKQNCREEGDPHLIHGGKISNWNLSSDFYIYCKKLWPYNLILVQ